MTTGLQKAGVDLDTLFMARVNTKRADVGYLSNSSVDISNRFEAIGSGTPIAATGLKSGGTDLASLFRNISEPLATVSIANLTMNSTSGSPRQADYMLLANGNLDTHENGGVTHRSGWVAPTSAAPGSYRVRATQVSNSGFASKSGTLGAWTAITTTQTWQLTQPSAGSSSWVLTIEIDDGAGNVLDTATITLQVTL